MAYTSPTSSVCISILNLVDVQTNVLCCWFDLSMLWALCTMKASAIFFLSFFLAPFLCFAFFSSVCLLYLCFSKLSNNLEWKMLYTPNYVWNDQKQQRGFRQLAKTSHLKSQCEGSPWHFRFYPGTLGFTLHFNAILNIVMVFFTTRPGYGLVRLNPSHDRDPWQASKHI